MNKAFLLSVFATPLLFAAPFNPKIIPENAQWYLHGDLEELRTTRTGKTIIAMISDEQGEKMAKVSRFLGFDPLTDLSHLTLFGDGKMNRAAIIFGGTMNRGHLERVIVRADDYQTAQHHKATIHIWKDKGKTQYASFLDNQTVVFSEQKDLVELALDVMVGEQAALKEAPVVATGDPVVLGVAHISNIELPSDEGSKIVRKAKTVAMALTEEGERLHGHLLVEAESDKMARTLMEALGGLIAIGTLTDEKIAALEIEHEGVAEGTTMDMSITIPVSKALALLSQFK